MAQGEQRDVDGVEIEIDGGHLDEPPERRGRVRLGLGRSRAEQPHEQRRDLHEIAREIARGGVSEGRRRAEKHVEGERSQVIRTWR